MKGGGREKEQFEQERLKSNEGYGTVHLISCSNLQPMEA